MKSPVQFYFDFSSPYGYLAAMKIDELAAKYGRDVEWHPVLLGVIFKITACLPLTQVPMKGKYSEHDFARTARFHDIPFVMPTVFPISSQHAARAVLWVANTQGRARSIAFAKALYHAFFVDQINISGAEQVIEIGRQFGLDAAALEQGIATAEVKGQLKNEIDEAIKAGVFGSPFVIVDGEPFWGFDRFDQIEATLKNGKI